MITGVQTGLLAGSIGTDTGKMAGNKDYTSGTGTQPTGAGTDANGSIGGGSVLGGGFAAKGWVPVAMDVLDSL